MDTRFAIVGLAALALVGCGEDDAVRSFTGGTSSKDKEEISSTLASASGAPAETAQTPAVGVEGPAVAEKDAVADKEKDLRETSMEYRASRTRDPFRSLVSVDGPREGLLDLSVVTLVGIVTGGDSFCVVEDAEGACYILRRGDRVKNGRVVSIKPDSIVASQTILGYTTTVQLKLEEKEVIHG